MTEKEFQEQVLKELKELNHKLFIDNGNPSMQSKINANTRKLNLVTGIFTVIGTFILGVVGFFIKKQIGE